MLDKQKKKKNERTKINMAILTALGITVLVILIGGYLSISKHSLFWELGVFGGFLFLAFMAFLLLRS